MAALSWDDLRLFLEVARTSTMGDAARAAGCDASTVSRRLSALERTMGAALVHRGQSQRRLTAAGAALRHRIEPIEKAVDEVLRWRAQSDTVEGTVRVTAPEEIVTHVIAPALPRLATRAP